MSRGAGSGGRPGPLYLQTLLLSQKNQICECHVKNVGFTQSLHIFTLDKAFMKYEFFSCEHATINVFFAGGHDDDGTNSWELLSSYICTSMLSGTYLVLAIFTIFPFSHFSSANAVAY